MSAIFESTQINSMSLRNRLVRSATWEGMAAKDGGVTDAAVGLYEGLAQGGVGLIVSSYLYVREDGAQLPGQFGVHKDELVPGLRRLTDAVHRHGGAIAAQIVHCGGQASSGTTGVVPVAPSAVESPGYSEIPRELSTAEVEELIEVTFPAAARRVKEAGFDAVQLHGAHGYLLAEFLSPSRNRRTDRFGGSLEGRTRFTIEVLRAVRAVVGPEFPVMIKLNANDFLEGSTTEVDAISLVEALARDGIDAIEVSGGTGGSGKRGAVRMKIDSPEAEAYFAPQARSLRTAAANVPLMLVGGLRSIEKLESLFEAGDADYFSMSRPLVREPDLPARWARGDREPAACESCARCFTSALKGGISCMKLGVA